MGVATAKRSRSKVAKASRAGIRLGLGPVGLGTDATILVPDSGTKMVDFDSLAVGANTVYRQRGRIAGAGAAELADVKNAAPAANLYGIVVIGNDANLGATVTPKAASVWDVSDRAARALGVIASITAAVDVSDRDVRLAGRVKILDSAGVVIDPALKGQFPAALVGGRLDINLGSCTAGVTLDVSDRAGRLVGVVYGSQGQQLKQTATNFNLQTEIAVGGVLVDPRSIRALTVADVVGLGAGTAQIGLVKVSDGTNTAIVKAASTAAAAGDAALVVSLSPNSSLPEQRAATLVQSTTAAVNTALTSTLPAAGAGLFHYITSIQIVKLYSVVGVAAGAGVVITTTNLNGLAFTTEQLASAAGTAPMVVNFVPATPLKSAVANTATTIVAPQQLQTIWRITVTYFTAP
jgi:hypothetical protein